MLNGTLYIVTSRPEDIPEAKFIISSGIYITNENADARLPSENELRVISPEEAKGTFGSGANRVDGVSVCTLTDTCCWNFSLLTQRHARSGSLMTRTSCACLLSSRLML